MKNRGIREGFRTVTPYLLVREPLKLLEFTKHVFGAVETFRVMGDAGGFHLEVRIGDSMLMMGGGGTWQGEPVPAALYLYVDDVDVLYARALEAGAETIEELKDHADGDRRAGVQDSYGNIWFIATHKG